MKQSFRNLRRFLFIAGELKSGNKSKKVELTPATTVVVNSDDDIESFFSPR